MEVEAVEEEAGLLSTCRPARGSPGLVAEAAPWRVEVVYW